MRTWLRGNECLPETTGDDPSRPGMPRMNSTDRTCSKLRFTQSQGAMASIILISSGLSRNALLPWSRKRSSRESLCGGCRHHRCRRLRWNPAEHQLREQAAEVKVTTSSFTAQGSNDFGYHSALRLPTLTADITSAYRYLIGDPRIDPLGCAYPRVYAKSRFRQGDFIGEAGLANLHQS